MAASPDPATLRAAVLRKSWLALHAHSPHRTALAELRTPTDSGKKNVARASS